MRIWSPILVATLLLAAVAAAITGASAVPAEPLAVVDLSRYYGRWYLIARLPATEPHPRGAWFEFSARPDGGINDVYSAREGSFDREPVRTDRRAEVDPAAPARWRVRTGWFSSREQWLLYVSPDYRYAIAGTPDASRAWILARDPVIPEWAYAGLLARLSLQGYDVAGVRRVPQRPEQLGRPGFE